MSSVGKSLPHDSARGHVTGEALFIDDARPTVNEVCVDCVGSPVAKGMLGAVDVSAAECLMAREKMFDHHTVSIGW